MYSGSNASKEAESAQKQDKDSINKAIIDIPPHTYNGFVQHSKSNQAYDEDQQ